MNQGSVLQVCHHAGGRSLHGGRGVDERGICSIQHRGTPVHAHIGGLIRRSQEHLLLTVAGSCDLVFRLDGANDTHVDDGRLLHMLCGARGTVGCCIQDLSAMGYLFIHAIRAILEQCSRAFSESSPTGGILTTFLFHHKNSPQQTPSPIMSTWIESANQGRMIDIPPSRGRPSHFLFVWRSLVWAEARNSTHQKPFQLFSFFFLVNPQTPTKQMSIMPLKANVMGRPCVPVPPP